MKSATSQFTAGRPVARLVTWGSRSVGSLRGVHGRRAALALVDQFMVGGANLLTVLLLGRLAGPKDLGVFALAMTVYYLLLAVQESLITVPYTIFGVRLRGVRHMQYSGACLCQSLAWSACVGASLLLVALSLSLFRGDAHLIRVVVVFALAVPLWLLREFGRRYLFVHMQLKKVLVMSIVGGGTQFIVLCSLAYSGRLSAVTAVSAIGIGSGISGFGWLWFSRAAFQFQPRRWSYFLRKNWLLGRWLIASQGTCVLSANIMPWFVLIWLGPTATGLFAACEAILRFANPIVVSLNNVLIPRVSFAHHDGGKAELNRIVKKASGLLALFLFAFCILLAVAGEWLLTQSFGNAYSGYGPTLVLLGVNQFVAMLSLATSRALPVLGRADGILRSEVAGFITSIVLGLLLVPLFGTIGAACALLASSTVRSTVSIARYLAAIRADEREPLFPTSSMTASVVTIGSVSE